MLLLKLHYICISDNCQFGQLNYKLDNGIVWGEQRWNIIRWFSDILIKPLMGFLGNTATLFNPTYDNEIFS